MKKQGKHTCTLCGEPTRRFYTLCPRCFKQYGEYIHEPWFKELATMQKRQDFIDSMENANIPDDVDMIKAGAILKTRYADYNYGIRKSRAQGQPVKATDDKKQHILELRAKGMSYRKIARIVGLGRSTINEIIRNQVSD